jgi:hypothetical protein
MGLRPTKGNEDNKWAWGKPPACQETQVRDLRHVGNWGLQRSVTASYCVPTGKVTAFAGTPLMVSTTGSAALVRASPGTTTLI